MPLVLNLVKEKSTDVIYPIILDNRLEIITRLPGQDTIYHNTTKISKNVLENTVEQLQKYLPIASREPDVKQYSQQLYDWLIKPIEANLATQEIKTLVFVLVELVMYSLIPFKLSNNKSIKSIVLN